MVVFDGKIFQSKLLVINYIKYSPILMYMYIVIILNINKIYK